MLQKLQSIATKSKRTSSLVLMGVAVMLTVGLSVAPRFVAAMSPEEEIRALQSENDKNQDVLAQLRDEAVSYRDAVTRLQSQITILQVEIAANTAKQTELNGQIEAGRLELARQRSLLGTNLRTMYLEGQISTIEMLATSKNLSDFVDKEEYRTAVKNMIQDTLQKIATLQNELRGQQQLVTALLNEQQAKQQTLTRSRAEQANMLSYNQSQQSAYNKKTAANQARIERLMEEQRLVNQGNSAGGFYFLRFPGNVGSFNPDNYPYKNAGFSMSTAPGCNDNDGPDKWGYCTRQCVSYAAWAVEASGRDAPVGYSDAKKWIAAAGRKGISVYNTPKPGDVAITIGGNWGHAMYVEKVDGDRIFISQYNAQLTGRYSTQWRDWR